MSDARPQTESELVELVRSIDVQAPGTLHARVDALIAENAGVRRRLWPVGPTRRGGPAAGAWRLGGALGLAALIVVALLVGLNGGTSPTLSVHEAAALTLRPATSPPPAESPRDRARLTAAVDGVSFPYWGARFGWRSSGTRSDTVGGRLVKTVFYSDGRGQRVGYAIVAGTPAPAIDGGAVIARAGRPYRVISEGTRRVVVWQRNGHLCVISGRGVSAATMLGLASWDERSGSAA
jgi:hypothetical protein